MRTTLRIQTLVGNAQPFHRPPTHQVLRHNLLCIFRLHIPVPNSLGINNHRRPMFALVQTQGLVDSHSAGQAGVFGQLAQPRVQFAFSIAGAAGSRRISGPDIVADKNVMFKCWQAVILPDLFT
jgi:hypothetical protein